MSKNNQSHIGLRIQSVIFTLLFMLVIGLLAWLGKTYQTSFDLTRNKQNSLSEATQLLLKKLDKPLKLTAFVPDDAKVHSALKKLVTKYQKYKKDTTLEFVNPDLDPERAKQEGILYSGQLQIKVGDRSEAINTIEEQQVVNVLHRLSRDKARLAIFIEGHGERSPYETNSSGLSQFTSVLERKGFSFQGHNLLRTQSIPDDASFIVIAAAEKDYLEGEVKAISEYIKKGGNLLWLHEPGSVHGLDDLEQQLGLVIPEGTLLDANQALQEMLGIKHPAVIPIVDYGQSELTRDLSSHTLFPFASAIIRDEEIKDVDWQYQPLLTTLPTSWLESGDIQGNVKFDDEADRPGPLDIAISMTRPKKEADAGVKQRVLVIGDSNFMLNSFIGQGSNLEFSSNIFNWLSEDDELLSIKSVGAIDTTLDMPGWALYSAAVFFLLILPIGLIIIGMVRWLRRRKR